VARYWPIAKPHNRTDRDCEAQIFKARNEGIVPSMSILALYERFSFGILSSSLAFSEEVIVRQLAAWGGGVVRRESTGRDVRRIYDAADGPRSLPPSRRAILLCCSPGPYGEKTLFVSSVADGYSSMINAVSMQLAGLHLSVEVSRLDIPFPRNALVAFVGGKVRRAVHAIRDSNAWDFYQIGEPLEFEDISHYRSSRKRLRLTLDIIASDLARYHYGTLDQDFWMSVESARIVYDRDFLFFEV
jgi:hypothetical protein